MGVPFTPSHQVFGGFWMAIGIVERWSKKFPNFVPDSVVSHGLVGGHHRYVPSGDDFLEDF